MLGWQGLSACGEIFFWKLKIVKHPFSVEVKDMWNYTSAVYAFVACIDQT
jgi:hypothetical protein